MVTNHKQWPLYLPWISDLLLDMIKISLKTQIFGINHMNHIFLHEHENFGADLLLETNHNVSLMCSQHYLETSSQGQLILTIDKGFTTTLQLSK